MAFVATSTPNPVSATASRVLIALATYQEHDNLAPLIREIHAFVPQAHVLVIDDNSPDGTGHLADELAAADSRVHVLHRSGKLGLGTAVLEAIAFAVGHHYELFVTMDADFSHPPRYLPNLLAGMRRHDLMIGSRYVPGGGAENWVWTRRLLSAGVNGLVRLLMRIPARDNSGNYRCYRVAKLQEADLTKLSHGYSFCEEVLFRCHQAGMHIGETPILFESRRSGSSKVNPAEALRSLGVLVWIGLGAMFNGSRRS